MAEGRAAKQQSARSFDGEAKVKLEDGWGSIRGRGLQERGRVKRCRGRRLREDWRQDGMDRYSEGFKRNGVVFWNGTALRASQVVQW